jgi:hypothetical protein
MNRYRKPHAKYALSLGEDVRILVGSKAGQVGRTTDVSTKDVYVRIDGEPKDRLFDRNAVISLALVRAFDETEEDDRNAAAFAAFLVDEIVRLANGAKPELEGKYAYLQTAPFSLTGVFGDRTSYFGTGKTRVERLADLLRQVETDVAISRSTNALRGVEERIYGTRKEGTK